MKKKIKKVALEENYNLFVCALGGIYYILKPYSEHLPIFNSSKIFIDTGSKKDIMKTYNKIEKNKQLIEWAY